MYPTKKLWEICDLYQPKTISTKEMIENWKYSVFWANWIIWRYNNYNHKEKEILITCRWATCWSINISEEFSWINWNAMVSHIKDNKIVYFNFLYYSFKNIDFSKVISGSAQPQITRWWLVDIPIPLPPLSTQKLIVQKLDSAFENIDKNINLTKENLKNLEELNKSVLEKIFNEWEYEKIDLIKIANFSNTTILPKDWDFYNYIWLENIESNTWKLVNFTETLWKKIRSNKVIFKKWMVLYWKLRPYLNKVLVSDFDWVATTEILPIECSNKLYNYFLWYFLRTDYFVNLANINISWARMPRVTTKFLKEQIQIPLPPLDKQKEIVSYLDQVFEKNKQLKTKYELQLKELEELKQSLLKEAFEWRLVKE